MSSTRKQVIRDIAVGRHKGAASGAARSVGLQALEVLEAGVIVCDIRQPDQPIIYANTGFQNLTGYSAEEIIGRNCRFLQGPETDPADVEKIRQALAAGQSTTVVIRNYRKNGVPFWNELQLIPHREQGRVTHYAGVQSDVTARVEAERRLRESEAQLRLLLDSTAEGIYGLDREGNCTFANATCVSILGFDSADQLVGRNMHDLIHYQHADGTPHPREQCQIYQAFRDGVGRSSDTEVFWRRDGTCFPARYFSYPIIEDGEVRGSVVSFSDITARKDTARRLAQRTRMLETVNQINVMLAGELDLDRVVQQVTDAGRMITDAEYGAFFYLNDVDGAERYSVYSLSGMARAGDGSFTIPASLELFDPVFEQQRTIRIDDVLLHHEVEEHNDQITVRSYLAVPVVSRTARTLGVLLYGHSEPGQFDETDQELLGGIAAQAAVAIDNARLYASTQRELEERREIERQLTEARQAADQSNRSKSEFLANMSHEIRTPMTAILGYADVLAEHLENPDNRDCVDVIKRNGRFLLNIVDDILDLSRIEAGKLRLECQPFRLDEIISDLRSLMEVRAQEKGLPLIVEYNGKVPEQVYSDPTRLRQILINLLSNAIKFTDTGSVQLAVSYLGRENDKDRLQFEVVDTGVGIAEQQQQEIFQPFSQADTSLTRQFEGSGLGLAISQRLAHMLGGKIEVRSTPGQGSHFTLALETEAVRGVQLVAPAHEIHLPEQTPLQRRRLSGHILVVDDRRDIRYLAQYFLEEAGAEVRSAENGAVALQLVEEFEQQGRGFDLILMDMQMPVLDGYEATRRLRSGGFEKPIIALTAGAMRKDRRNTMQAGCDAHVSKPIDGAALVNLVAHYIDDVDTEKLKTQRELQASGVKRKLETSTRRNILIVDDSCDAVDAMVKLFQMLGHRVEGANNGREALAKARELQPDFVILDLGLPDIDGYEVARRLRADPATGCAQIVALSGREGDAGQLREAGFDHHFMKPADLAALKALLEDRRRGPGLSGRTS